MKFPVYRKMDGFERWYKIVSDNEFYECYKVGTNLKINHVIAHQYPEKLRIMDMLTCNNPFIEAENIESLFL